MAKARLAFAMRAHRPGAGGPAGLRDPNGHATTPHLAAPSAPPAARSGGGRADRRRSRRGLPRPAHHRAEYGRQDGRAEDDRPPDAHGADGTVHSGGRHVRRLGLSRRLYRHRRRAEHRAESFDLLRPHPNRDRDAAAGNAGRSRAARRAGRRYRSPGGLGAGAGDRQPALADLGRWSSRRRTTPSSRRTRSRRRAWRTRASSSTWRRWRRRTG